MDVRELRHQGPDRLERLGRRHADRGLHAPEVLLDGGHPGPRRQRRHADEGRDRAAPATASRTSLEHRPEEAVSAALGHHPLHGRAFEHVQHGRRHSRHRVGPRPKRAVRGRLDGHRTTSRTTRRARPTPSTTRMLRGVGDSRRSAIIRPRTYAIGIAPEVGRCELNRVAYRGRSDASATQNARVPPLRPVLDVLRLGRRRSTCRAVTRPRTTRLRRRSSPRRPGRHDDSVHGRTTPRGTRRPRIGSGHGRALRPDKPDYAFFALDADADREGVLRRSSPRPASGDYSTSAPVSGGAISQGPSRPPALDGLPGLDAATSARSTRTVRRRPTFKWDAADVLNDPQQDLAADAGEARDLHVGPGDREDAHSRRHDRGERRGDGRAL